MATSKDTNKSKKWCVKKFSGSDDLLLINKDDLHEDDWSCIFQTRRAMKSNPQESNPQEALETWIKFVPDQLNPLAGEINELTTSDDRDEEFFGLDLLDILMDPYYSNASPTEVLHGMLPMIMWKASYEIWALTDFYKENEGAIEELGGKLISGPEFPDTLTQLDFMLHDVLPEYKYYCIARDESVQMAIRQREKDHL